MVHYHHAQRKAPSAHPAGERGRRCKNAGLLPQAT